MSSWITKAANVFRRDDAPGPQPFDVPCECGQHHVGIRRNRHQHLVCKVCGASVFILPRDVYPPPREPREPAKKKKKRTKPKLVEPVPSDPLDISEPAEIEDAPASHPAKKRPPLPKRRSTAKTEEAESRPEALPWSTLLRTVLAAVSASVARAVWSFWTPFRTALVAIACLIVMASLSAWRKNALDDAAQIVKEQSAAAMTAVEKQDWTAASEAFSEVSQALDVLGRDDREAETWRQLGRETSALTRLSATSFFEILDEAEAVTQTEGFDTWARKLGAHRGNWIVIDGPVHSTPESETGYRLDFPWLTKTGHRPVIVQLAAVGLERVVPPNESVPVIFAGQLDDCRLSHDGKEWIVVFRRETGFLWAHPETFASLGFDPDPGMSARLEDQANAIGVDDD